MDEWTVWTVWTAKNQRYLQPENETRKGKQTYLSWYGKMDNYPQTHSTCASWIARQSNQSAMMKMTWLVLFCSAPKQTSRSMDSRIVTSVILCLACLGTCQSSSFQCALVQWTVMVIPYDSEGNELGWVINQISSWERLEDNRRESNLIFPPRMAVCIWRRNLFQKRRGEWGQV